VNNPLETGEVGVEAREATDPVKVGGMLTKNQVEAIVAFERGL
jgi:hypothetical protein